MTLLIGTANGMFRAKTDGAPAIASGDLDGRNVRAVVRVNGDMLAGADAGVFRSGDGGASWQRVGAEGRAVWDIARAPDDPRTVYAVTQPAGLFRSRDGGATWSEVESLVKMPGAETWCVPVNPPQPGRARTVAFDPRDPARLWVGIEVGGVAASDDWGATWSLTLPGGNPDIHVMATDPARAGVVYATTGYGRIDNSEPMERRVAGLFRSDDHGRTWRFLWADLQPKYTRPLCVDPRPPHAITVACSPTAFSSHRDPGGARAMLYRSDDGGDGWRPLGDAAHSPSAAQLLSVTADPESAGSVLVGTDTGELWRVTAAAEWTLRASGLPPVQAVYGEA